MCGKSLYHQSDRRDGQKNLNNNTRVNWISWSDPAPPADIIGRMTGNLPYWVTVAEVEGGDDLPKESSCFFGGQATFLDEVVEQFPSADVLQDQVQVFSVLVHVVQRQHVLVLDQLHDGDLPLHLLQHGLAQLLLVDDLDGHLLPQHAVCSKLDQTWKWNSILIQIHWYFESSIQ